MGPLLEEGTCSKYQQNPVKDSGIVGMLKIHCLVVLFSCLNFSSTLKKLVDKKKSSMLDGATWHIQKWIEIISEQKDLAGTQERKESLSP